MVQVGNGWYNPDSGKFTSYDPATGQVTTKVLADAERILRDPKWRNDIAQKLASGQFDPNRWFVDAPNNAFGGRSNINLTGQIAQVSARIMQQYPQMSKESAMKYANDWISTRIANGQDANQIEDMAKGMGRDDKMLGDEMWKGINDTISRDAFSAQDPNSTGASMQDPRQSIQDELRQFAGHMMSVLPPDSPQVQRIAEMAAQAGNKYATQSGMGPGGLTATGVSGVTNRALVDLQTQRESIGANALAAAGNQQLSVDQLNTQLQQQNQQANVLQGSNIGGMIGTGAGMIGGIVASAYGAPQAMPGLVQAGGSAGQAIGGIASNANQAPIQYGGGVSAPRSSYAGRNWGGGTS